MLDLACGDAGLAEPLLAEGLRYVGVDLSAPMVEAARRRVGDRAEIVLADLNDYRPPAPVACTTCFRAVYYARDRRAFFRHSPATRSGSSSSTSIRASTASRTSSRDLKAAGLARVELHPFFFPQRHGLPGRSPPPSAPPSARARSPAPLLRVRFSYLVSASREG